MNASEGLLASKYFSDLVAEQMINQIKLGIPERREDEKTFVIQLSTAPLATVLRKGPCGLNPECLCARDDKHISFFDALKARAQLTDFCPDRNTFLVHRLPCWLTGLKNKKEFVDLPSIFHVFNVFRNGTYWWRSFAGSDKDKPFALSREARLLLFSCTGLNLTHFPFMETRKLLGLRCSRPALHRLRNWFITLDGILMSILLGSQGHPELCNWEFFDRIMQTYLKTAIGDLFKQNDEVTYYSRLKECRNLMKDRILKERTLLEKNPQGNYFSGNFWYFDKVVKVLNLNVEKLNPKQLQSVAYLTQTRASGLPPKPVEVRATTKFFETVGKVPKPMEEFVKFELSRAIDSLCLDLKSRGNFEGLLNYANSHSKISLSNSASFNCTRDEGGKVESARRLLNELPIDCPFFDLDTGKILFRFGPENQGLTPGEKLFHFSILRAITSLTDTDQNKPHIGDVRYSTVPEPGKARIITISTIEHSVLLHPLAHFLSVLIATIPSSTTGMLASNHMWDTFKRMGRENIPMDGIYSEKNPATVFMGSEDWESATDSINPYPVMVIFDGLQKNLGIPKFYSNLCKTLLCMPRRIYSKEILVTREYSRPTLVKLTGIFQGDPCCKQMLHLTHILSRKVARNHLKRIGMKSITPPLVLDKVGNRFGSIPNTLILRSRLPRKDYLKEVEGIIKRERVEKEGDIRKDLLRTIKKLS
jgi:hypothetical protein